ncbi:hypothetical protein ACIRL3_27675 [Streptomyces sp. NPDC102384]|uniref:hypothetical protein n=1 Tax=Streptomyces sp. NPDC102384 TaxID=3366166 RepID=UPI00382AFA7A
MDAELTALAASGATTLVSLMVTDSWARARELVSRFLAREDSTSAALTSLDEARSRLLVTADSPEDDRSRVAVTTECQTYLQHLTATSSVTPAEFRTMITALQRLASTSVSRHSTVNNRVDGGFHHSPIIQSGTITGLTLHVHRPEPGPGEQQS